MRLRDGGLIAAGKGLGAAEVKPMSLRARSAWLAQHVLPHELALRAWLRQCDVGAREADDIIYETYAAFDGVEAPPSPAAQVFEIAQSVMRRLERAGAPWIGDNVVRLSPARVEPPAQAQERPDLAPAHLRVLIGELPPECRKVFSLRIFDGLSQRDIAARMALSESQVETHIAGALRYLMSAMSRLAVPSETPRRAATPARS